MQHQTEIAQTQGVDEGFEITGVIDEAILEIRTLRAAHADQIDRQHPAQRLQLRNDVAPQVAGGRIAVQQQDRIALADFDVVHARAEHLRVA